MNDFQKNKDNRDIDLSEFDLTDFKEYFEEEDAQREAEAKEKAEREAKEEAERLAEEKRIQLEKQQKIEEEERLIAEEIAAQKKAEFKAREKEEARRAAERAAEAALAAKKAEEFKAQEQKEILAKLNEQVKVNQEASAEQPKIEAVVDEATKIEFDALSSILDIKSNTVQTVEVPSQIDVSATTDENKSKKKSTIATIICVVLLVAAIVCASLAIWNFIQKADTSTDNEDIPSATEQPGTFRPFDDLIVNYNNTEYPTTINENLKAMYSENSDLTGWLTIDGTAVDYPIVQDSTNKYYLYNHNVFNENARYGTPFIDFRCAKNGLSKNTVIYGHRMNSDTHFGSLDNFTDPEYYKNHPVIKYETLTETYIFKIYAVFYATTQGSVDGGYVFDYYNPDMSDESFAGYIEMLNQYALYTTDAGLEKTDKIITLSTCSHVYDNLKSGGVDARFVVVGRLLRNGETETDKADAVTVNSDYRKPQIWYDKYNKTNPYMTYRNWKPSK